MAEDKTKKKKKKNRRGEGKAFLSNSESHFIEQVFRQTGGASEETKAPACKSIFDGETTTTWRKRNLRVPPERTRHLAASHRSTQTHVRTDTHARTHTQAKWGDIKSSRKRKKTKGGKEGRKVSV